MADRNASSPGPESMRTRYLKLRSVLFDRNTDLPAYVVLIDELRALLEQRRQLGVLELRIENLGVVESLYGWQVFDRILRRAADELRRSVGEELPGGTLVAQGGVAEERFLAFVPERPDGSEVDGPYLNGLAQGVRARLDRAFRHADFDGLNPELELHAGHSMLSLNPFFRFERRLSAAIDEARRSYALREQRRELSLGEELNRLIREAGVETLYQPVVDLASNEVVGYEAFARGPRDSPIEMPQALFALSRRAGMDARLDRVCTECAVRNAAGMSGRGKLFLNVLPVSVLEGAWQPDAVSPLFGDGELRPADLVLEFSERLADPETEQFIALMRRAKEDGYAVALDDIGTGYASRTILEAVQPDYLKLDVSLVRGIDESLIKQELLQSLVRIAERIGATLIAEGVETEPEARALARAGARLAQGHLFAGPGPAERWSTVRRRSEH